jgi:hypothetical protein
MIKLILTFVTAPLMSRLSRYGESLTITQAGAMIVSGGD